MTALLVRKLTLIQGEYRVSTDPAVMISTILGSCVAACIRDPLAGVGGMNHFLLPGTQDSEGMQYGAYAMELLINAILQRGGRRDRLEAKLFGGGRMLQGLTDIGRQNSAFARKFLQDEGIGFAGGSLGGDHARRVLYWPVTGVARQQKLEAHKSAFSEELTRAGPIGAPAAEGEVEMFGT